MPTLQPVTHDNPVSNFGFKTYDEACEAIFVIELRMFDNYDEIDPDYTGIGTASLDTKIDDFEEAVMGKLLEEMTEKEVKTYAKFLIEQVQGTNEGVFSGAEFSD